MSIAIPTYAPGAITNYAELVVEIRDLMDDADYSQQAIDRALRKAEAEFNRTLRTPEMETRVVLSITSELTPLPNDFLELRYIFSEGSPDTPLKSMSPAGMLSAYSGVSGTPQAYTIEGGQLRIGPVGNATLEMVLLSAAIRAVRRAGFQLAAGEGPLTCTSRELRIIWPAVNGTVTAWLRLRRKWRR
ncbi:phage adaptor protein [Sphingomonas sp. MMS24-JH45]